MASAHRDAVVKFCRLHLQGQPMLRARTTTDTRTRAARPFWHTCGSGVAAPSEGEEQLDEAVAEYEKLSAADPAARSLLFGQSFLGANKEEGGGC